MKIIVNGAKGHMGKILCELLEKNFEGHTLAAGTDGKGNLAKCNVYADCVVDFSNHSAAEEVVGFCLDRKVPLVMATTGHSDDERKVIIDAGRYIPVFYSANMSIGVAWLCQLAKKTAEIFPNADIEIIEKHHNRKIDVPSGTALMIGNEILKVREDAQLITGRHLQGKRDKNEIGIHSLRMGNVTGIHEVIVSTEYQTITLTHEAHNRGLFGEGALVAASFLEKKGPGIYTMEDLINT